MRRVLLFAMVLVLASTGGGCATVLNMQDTKMNKPYGGFTMSLTDFCGGEPAGEYAGIICWPIWLADKPLSLFGDTIALPYILWLKRDAEKSPPEQKAEPVPPS